MATGERVLLLTRPEAQSRVFLAEFQARLGRGVSSVISPVMRIVPVKSGRDLSRYATIIVTSSNAVSRDLAGRRVVTVGEKTAAKAQAAGAEARCLGETVDAFLKRIAEVRLPALYLHGVHTRGDMVERARSRGVVVDEAVVYDQAEIALTQAAQDALASGRALVPLFSPRSAALVAAYRVAPGTRVVAISEATADAWTAPGEVMVALHPDQAAMLEAVAEAF